MALRNNEGRPHHSIIPVTNPSGEVIAYEIVSPGGRKKFQVGSDHPHMKAIINQVLAEAQNGSEMMAPIDFGLYVIEVLEEAGFSDEVIPKSPMDAMIFALRMLEFHNKLEQEKTKALTFNATQALLQKYIESLNMDGKQFRTIPWSLRKQLLTLNTSLTILALEQAGVGDKTAATARVVLSIERDNAAAARIAMGVIELLQGVVSKAGESASKLLVDGGHAVAEVLPEIGDGLGRGAGGIVGGAIAGVRDSYQKKPLRSQKNG